MRSPDRRPFRVKCQLDHNARRWIGYSTSLSEVSIYVRVPRDDSKDVVFDAESPVELMFYPPGETRALRTTCRVSWVESAEYELDGRAATGVVLEFARGAELQARIGKLLADLKPTLLLLDADDEERAHHEVLAPVWRIIDCPLASDALAILGHEDVQLVVCGEHLTHAGSIALIEQTERVLPRARFSTLIIGREPQVDALEQMLNLSRPTFHLRKPFASSDLQRMVRRAFNAYATAFDNDRLSIELECANSRLERENRYLRERANGLSGFEDFVGSSESLRRALADLEKVRRTDITVHLQGETGTGKEIAARALHHGSPRANKPFIVQNCGGMAETLLQSTLFGHRRGAFTGAERDQRGVFQEAEGGTLFLDEVAELPPAIQAALLRALQQREVLPVGASKPEKVDVRVVSATHKDLRQEIVSGRFREDLYFRLVVITVRLPPLRERIGDVVLLARHFLDQLAARYGSRVRGFTEEAMQALNRYAWPGNVRELENEIARAVVLDQGEDKITLAQLSPHIQAAVTTPGRSNDHAPTLADAIAMIEAGASIDEVLSLYERRLIEDTLRRVGDNRSSAAKFLGIPRQTLVSRLKKVEHS